MNNDSDNFDDNFDRRSGDCALALAVLGRGRADYSGETRTDYARKCAGAERVLIEADDGHVSDAVRRMSAGSTINLVGHAIRSLACRRFTTEELALTPPGSAQ
jgi:hypothetical protein